MSVSQFPFSVTRTSASLFPWSTSPYNDNIHSYLKSQELRTPKIRHQSPQAASRKVLVEWIQTVAESNRLTRITVHLAVYILDQFMDKHNIDSDDMGVVSMVCLLIASKYDEDVAIGPELTIQSLLSLLPETARGTSNSRRLAYLEKYVLSCLNWRLGWPTVATFAEYYSLFAVVNGDQDPEATSHRSLKRIVQSSFDAFVDKTLMSIDLVNTPRSNVAAACLLAARVRNSVTPVWPDSLRKITWLSYEILVPVARSLLSPDDNEVNSL